MTQSRQQPDLLDRVIKLEGEMSELRTSAEALLQIAQIHQQNFERITTELIEDRQITQIRQQNFERELAEDRQRFEILLAEARQDRLRIDQTQEQLRVQQGQIAVLLERLLKGQNGDQDHQSA